MSEGCSALSCDHVVVGEHDVAAHQFRRVNGFETLNGRRLAMPLLRSFVREDKQVNELRGVVLVLPCEIHLCARLAGFHVLYKLRDGLA